jgi:hypothetical protein
VVFNPTVGHPGGVGHSILGIDLIKRYDRKSKNTSLAFFGPDPDITAMGLDNRFAQV